MMRATKRFDRTLDLVNALIDWGDSWNIVIAALLFIPLVAIILFLWLVVFITAPARFIAWLDALMDKQDEAMKDKLKREFGEWADREGY